MTRQTVTVPRPSRVARPRVPAPARSVHPLGGRRRPVREDERMTRVFRTLGSGLVTQYGAR